MNTQQKTPFSKKINKTKQKKINSVIVEKPADCGVFPHLLLSPLWMTMECQFGDSWRKPLMEGGK